MTNEIVVLENAGLENDGLENDVIVLKT